MSSQAVLGAGGISRFPKKRWYGRYGRYGRYGICMVHMSWYESIGIYQALWHSGAAAKALLIRECPTWAFQPWDLDPYALND